MKIKRREYALNLTINDIRINKVVIDPHYEEKHSVSVSDEIILALVKMLDGGSFRSVDEKAPFRFFVNEGLLIDDKAFRLIWSLEDHEIYVGVLNAYRRKLT
jgi:hypothetical protein